MVVIMSHCVCLWLRTYGKISLKNLTHDSPWRITPQLLLVSPLTQPSTPTVAAVFLFITSKLSRRTFSSESMCTNSTKQILANVLCLRKTRKCGGGVLFIHSSICFQRLVPKGSIMWRDVLGQTCSPLSFTSATASYRHMVSLVWMELLGSSERVQLRKSKHEEDRNTNTIQW